MLIKTKDRFYDYNLQTEKINLAQCHFLLEKVFMTNVIIFNKDGCTKNEKKMRYQK